jgi:hypothetical protein
LLKNTTFYNTFRSEERTGTMSGPPSKYAKVNGIMKLNPEYKRWKESQGQTATSMSNSGEALAVVTSMDDHMAFNEAVVHGGGREVPLSESTNATIEMLQDPEMSAQAGMSPDSAIDELGPYRSPCIHE